MHRQSAVVVALLAWVLFSGCSGEPPSPAEPEPAYRLPFFKRSQLPELQEQFRRLSRRGELPWQLRDVPVPPAENAAPELQKLFAGQQPQQVFQALGDYFPASKLLEDAVRLEQAVLQAGRWSQQLAQAQAAMLRPRCVFPIPYEKGLEADLSFVFRVRAVARVAVLQAMQATAQQNQAAALDHLVLALRLAGALQGHKHPVVRLQAAAARAEVFDALQAVLLRFAWSSDQLGRLLDVLQRSETTLPPDRDAWVVDRTLGLHFYELLRAGAWNQLITPEDLKRLGTELAQKLRFATAKELEQDEAYYLKEMDRLIALAAKPYYRRRSELVRLEKKWRVDAQRYPAATVLLLPDVLPGMARQGLDRSRLQGWILGLQHALGHPPEGVVLSPLTGQPFRVVERPKYLVVLGIGAVPGEPEVPLLIPKLKRS